MLLMDDLREIASWFCFTKLYMQNKKHTHKKYQTQVWRGQVVCRVTWPLVLSDTQGLICTITAATKVGTPSNSTNWSRWDWSTGFITGTRRHSDLFLSLVLFSSGLLFKKRSSCLQSFRDETLIRHKWLFIVHYKWECLHWKHNTTTIKVNMRATWSWCFKVYGGWRRGWRRRGAGVNGQTIK